jgi:Na+/melibiose symporter-like transporter
MRLARYRTGLWRSGDFLNLWGAATVSTFGTLITGTALPFTAILVLDASPADLSALRIAQLLPGFICGLIAGSSVDRLRRRPIMIATDLARAGLLLTVPAAYLLGSLGLGLLLAVTALVSVSSVFFDVAYQSYLPSIVERKELIEANSKLTAAGSVAEAAAFTSAGWLIQLLTAPLAIVIDALTYVASAALVTSIRRPEMKLVALEEGPSSPRSIATEIGDGLRTLWRQPVLRGMMGAGIIQSLAFGLIGTVFLLYVNQEIGFPPAALGMIFAVGGVTSFLGAIAANRLSGYGVGTIMVGSLVLVALGEAMIPLAAAANLVGTILLIGQQIVVDPAMTVYDISQVSLRQAIAPESVLGRVNAGFRVAETGALLLGTVAAGYLGEAIGLRATLWLASAICLVAAVMLYFSPVSKVNRIPEMAAEVPT